MGIEQDIQAEHRTDVMTSALPRTPPPVFVSQSPIMSDILAKIRLIANSQASVLITGESGTGKEVIANLIHHFSSNTSRPFVAINSAALPKDVIDNELFGHEKEAYTGAISKKLGCFELSNHGTLFLDEIVEMHPQTQAKLLRAIENKSIRRLGGKEDVHVDVRIIAATNRSISASLQSGDLREDLFYRLSVIEIPLPSLRERKEDITLLLNHFVSILSEKYEKTKKQFSDECLAILNIFDWPGNVRELRNVVERVVLTCPDDIITLQYLPERISGHKVSGKYLTIPIGTPMRVAEKMLIDQTLVFAGNNKPLASRILGISKKTLYNKLRRSSVCS